MGGSAVGVGVALVLLGVVFFFAWKATQTKDADETEPLTLEERYENDGRLRPLLAKCPFGGSFDADTTDLASVLAAKLDAGAQLEPLRRAKSELASMGDEVAEPLMRLFRDAIADRYRAGVAKNVLVVCALAESDWGVPIALEALGSPAPDIRADGTIVIKNHPSPEHYDALEAILPGFRLPVNVDRCVDAMHACDPERLARQIPTWIEEAEPDEGYINSARIDTALQLVADSRDPEIADLLLEVAKTARGLLHRHTPYLLAPAARQGNEAALQDLTDALAHPQNKPRYHAVQALVRAGHAMEAYPVAVTADAATERAATLGLVLNNGLGEERTEADEAEVTSWARFALNDESIEVREVALKALIARGDEEGFAYLMNLLPNNMTDRGIAMRSMRNRLDDKPEWAAQILSVLIGLWEREAQGAQRGMELTSILSTIGAIPGEATGRFALQAADQIGNNSVRGDRGFHWAVGQAFNAGPAARKVLRERYRVEEDPFNRLDLVSFLWQDFSSDASLDLLLESIENEALSPYERLYAASCVVKMKSSRRVLPVMKRVHRSTDSPVLRRGLHCLLWIWFGPAVT